MSLTKRFAVLAMVSDPVLFFAAMFMIVRAVSRGFGWLSFLPALALLAALPLLILGYNLQKPVMSRNVCLLGLFLSVFGLFSVVGGCYFYNNGVWQPDEYAQLRTAENLTFTWSAEEGGRLTLDEADSERLLALWQQVKYRGHSEQLILPTTEYYALSQQRDLYTELPDGSRVYVIVRPPYYVASVGTSSTMDDYYAGRITECIAYVYPAADQEICQQLADLYAELEAKYYPKYAELAAAELGS